MCNSDVVYLAKKIAVCCDSMRKEFHRAGGAAPNLADLEKMSAIDLIAIMAPNNIGFKYVGE